MPVTYEIDKKRGIIRTRCVGDVTFEEVLGHFRTLVSDPDCPERLDVLLDLSAQTILPNSGQLRGVSQEIAKVRDRVRFDACAIVAPSDALFGLIRMFEVFAEGQFRATRVFRAVEEAEAWLLAEQSSVG
jgi:hypothetical protein